MHLYPFLTAGSIVIATSMLTSCDDGLWTQTSMRSREGFEPPMSAGRSNTPTPSTATLGGGLAAAMASPSAPGFPEDLALSPDGSVLIFAWAGDLWSVASTGGAATRLTSHPAEEGRSAFSPDGRWLAFESDRDGARNLYVMSITPTPAGISGGAALRVTSSDRAQSLSGWSSDGRALLFNSLVEPSVYRSMRMYRVELPAELAIAPPTNPLGIIGGAVSEISPAMGYAPRMSNDGSTIVFGERPSPQERPKYRGSGTGDLWKFRTTDASVTRLTDDPANDFDPWPMPDGSVVCVSSKDQHNNLWRIPAGGGAWTQLTNFAPTPEQMTIAHGVRELAVSRDGRVAAFVVWNRMYRLDLTKPPAVDNALPLEVTVSGDVALTDYLRVSADREGSEFALSPDGKTVAIAARGDVFVRSTSEGYPTRRVTNTPGRERDLAWSPDGRVLYFASDQSESAGGLGADGAFDRGRYRIFEASVALSREDVSNKPKDEAKKDDDKKTEAEDKKEPADAKPADAPAGTEAGDKPKGDNTDDKKSAKADKKDKKPDFGKRWNESLTFEVKALIENERDARRPVPSPDGRLLLYTRHLGDLILRDLETGSERVLLASWNEPEALWASDSRHIVYAVEDLDFNSDIWLLDSGGADAPADLALRPVNLTQHPDNDVSPRLSADGKVLLFLSERADQSDQMDVHSVYLDIELEGTTSYERDEYFKKAGEAASKRKPIETPKFSLAKSKPAQPEAGAEDKDKATAPKKPAVLKFDAEDAYLRIRRITSAPGGKRQLALTPGGDRIVFAAPGDSESTLVSTDHKGGDKKVIQTGSVSAVDVSLSGDKVLFIRQGVVNTAPKLGGKVDALAIDAPIIVNAAAQQRQKFLEMARTFGDRFYHPTMKGLDWTALTRRYLPLAEATRTNSAFNQVCTLMFGELEGSHTGAFGGNSAGGFTTPSPSTGYLGTLVKPVAGGYEVTRVTESAPAAQASSRINIGDVILAVDGVRAAPDNASLPTTSLDTLLQGRAGRETLIELRRAASAAPASTPAQSDTSTPANEQSPLAKPFVLITPISWSAWDALAYASETRRRRAEVERLSGGRLGYLHIRAMGEASVREYERDLFAAANGKDALIIDVRDNGGGSTADILLSSLTAPRHAWTVPRGADPNAVPRDSYPRDRRLIYAWTRPINVLINQNSFSNAEIFAHAVKSTKRGRVIGTPTFGGVISTGAFTLIDGTTIRMPFRGWYLPDGTDMENNGTKPDLSVAFTPSDQAAGRDPQLEAAVQDFLKQLPAK